MPVRIWFFISKILNFYEFLDLRAHQPNMLAPHHRKERTIVFAISEKNKKKIINFFSY